MPVPGSPGFFELASQSESSRVTFFPSLEGPELASAAGYNLPGLRDPYNSCPFSQLCTAWALESGGCVLSAFCYLAEPRWEADTRLLTDIVRAGGPKPEEDGGSLRLYPRVGRGLQRELCRGQGPGRGWRR